MLLTFYKAKQLFASKPQVCYKCKMLHTLQCWIEVMWLLFGTCLLFGSCHFYKYEACVLFGSIGFWNEPRVLFGLCWVLSETCVYKKPNSRQALCTSRQALCTRSQSHECYFDWAKITYQSHVFEYYLEWAFFTNQRLVYYLDHLFYSALTSNTSNVEFQNLICPCLFVIRTVDWTSGLLFSTAAIIVNWFSSCQNSVVITCLGAKMS